MRLGRTRVGDCPAGLSRRPIVTATSGRDMRSSGLAQRGRSRAQGEQTRKSRACATRPCARADGRRGIVGADRACDMERLPPSLRLINRVGRVWRSAGGSPRALRADALLSEALSASGRADLGPVADYRPGLDVLLSGLQRAPHLSTVGRVIMTRRIRTVLTHRAERETWCERSPERFRAPLPAPLIIVGLPRTGTTFLHHLLSSVPNTRSLALWQVSRPFPPVEGPDRRRAAAKRLMGWIGHALPEFEAKHDTDADAPEECMHIMNLSFYAWTYWSMAGIPGYREWWWEADPEPAYRAWSEALRFEQFERPQDRLVLKSPSHTAQLAALLAAEPDARIVFTHRDVASVVPSFASLIRTMRRATYLPEYLDRNALGAETLDQLARTADRARAARSSIPADRLVDVPFEALRADPVGVVERIHKAFGFDWDPRIEQAVREAAENKGHRKSSGHRYSAEEFGLNKDEIRERIPTLLP
ncbi:MAG: hypothetical protein CL927_10640 [Deltaproteobacteria bacterium]|nr:hypothetical protein [Deltaproteobacteria bacterium]